MSMSLSDNFEKNVHIFSHNPEKTIGAVGYLKVSDSNGKRNWFHLRENYGCSYTWSMIILFHVCNYELQYL